MPVVDCPLCGKPVQAPDLRPRTRLHCRKCHTPLHVGKAGEIALGEPPDIELEVQELKNKLRDVRRSIPVGRIVKWSAAVVVVGWLGYALFGPAERLRGPAERAARAFADDDLAYLQSIAAPGTAEDLARWYAEARPQLVLSRERWGGKEETIDVQVAEEDHDAGKGSVGVLIHPAAGTARSVDLANPSEATATAAAEAPVALMLKWTLGSRGRWQLDGRAMLDPAQPAPPPPDATAQRVDRHAVGSR